MRLLSRWRGWDAGMLAWLGGWRGWVAADFAYFLTG